MLLAVIQPIVSLARLQGQNSDPHVAISGWLMLVDASQDGRSGIEGVCRRIDNAASRLVTKYRVFQDR